MGLRDHFESRNNLFGMLLPNICVLSYISEGCVVVVVVFITQYRISMLHNQLKI